MSRVTESLSHDDDQTRHPARLSQSSRSYLVMAGPALCKPVIKVSLAEIINVSPVLITAL